MENNYFNFPMDMVSQSFSAVTTVIGICVCTVEMCTELLYAIIPTFFYAFC